MAWGNYSIGLPDELSITVMSSSQRFESQSTGRHCSVEDGVRFSSVQDHILYNCVVLIKQWKNWMARMSDMPLWLNRKKIPSTKTTSTEKPVAESPSYTDLLTGEFWEMQW